MIGCKRRPRSGLLAWAAACATASILAAPGGLTAQEWRLDAQGGRLRFDANPAAEVSSTAVAGLRYLHGSRWLALFAGAPLGGEDRAWGLAAGNLRLLAGGAPELGGGLRFGVDLGGELFLQGDTEAVVQEGGPLPGIPGRPGRDPLTSTVTVEGGWGAVAEAMPLLLYERGGWSGELRAGAARYHNAFGEEASDRDVLRVHGQVGFAPVPAVQVSAEASWHEAEEGAYPYVGLAAAGLRGPLLGWVSVGAWLEESVDVVPWSVGARYDVMERVALTATARRAAFDPLYRTGETTSWSLGASVLLKGPPAPAPPIPARYDNGVAAIALPLDEARGVPMVAGDFNDWTPQAMQRGEDGWTFSVRLEPGVYYYAFTTPEGTWYVPDSVAGRQDDGFGGHVAVLVVQ